MDTFDLFKADNRRIVLVLRSVDPSDVAVVDLKLRASLMDDDEDSFKDLISKLRANGVEEWEWERYKKLFDSPA